MSEKPLPFVITDRRKFNTEGEPRPDADPSPERTREPAPERTREPAPERTREASPERTPEPAPEHTREAAPAFEGAAPPPPPAPELPAAAAAVEIDLPPAPTPEEMEQSRLAFQATAERLDIAVRAANPGVAHPPAMTFEQLVQSVYMQAIMQLGGGTQEGQQPQVDILGARQSIDMLGILSDKTAGNLSATEQTLLSSAIFELRLAFLEITQALARSAQQRPGSGIPPPPGGRPGPSIVR